MAAVSLFGPWAGVLVILLILSGSFAFVLAALGKILASPARDVRLKVVPLPWPRVEIDVKAPPPGDVRQ